MTRKELEKIGLIIYACEGTKLRPDKRRLNGYNYAIEVTNSNPAIIKLFLKFLREIIQIKERKLRGQLFVYQDLDLEKLLSFWSRETKIPLTQFNKSISLTPKGSKYKPNPLGTFKIRYYDKDLRLRLEELLKELLVV